MKKKERDFLPGEECLYCEDGGITRCEVADIRVEDGFLRVELKVLEVIQNPRFDPASVDPLVIGQTINVKKEISQNLSQANGMSWDIVETSALMQQRLYEDTLSRLKN